MAAKKAKKVKKKVKKTYSHHPDHYNRSEDYLIENLNEELKEAWFKIREFGESLGEQKIYASGQAIMFSKKVCYFFVRPKKKSYLETVIFLKRDRVSENFKSAPASKTKYYHTYRLIHADQVESELTDAITDALRSRLKTP